MVTQSIEAWRSYAKKAQDIRDTSIAQVDVDVSQISRELPLNVTGIPETILSSHDTAITQNNDAVSLIQKMKSKELSAEEVVTAFLRRAVIASKLTNCITELLPNQARERAKELDQFMKQNGKVKGPLHGLPISVKEHIGMKGLTHNAGFAAWVDDIAEEDAALLTVLLDAGAVLFARTTQPQTLMANNTSSALFGETCNPHNTNLSPGGSSGGEGALVGLHGSPMGIGTDIGGSIRSPAAFNGLFGLRPTTLRLPYDGTKQARDGQESVKSVIGPIAHSVRDLQLFMKTVIDAQPWVLDPKVIPLPWREFKRDVTIGVIWEDGIVMPHPPITRALSETVAKLKATGMKVVDLPALDHARGIDIVGSMYFPDGAADDTAIMAKSGEPWMPLTEFALKGRLVKKLSIADNWKLNLARDKFKADYYAHVKEYGVDVVLCPANGMCATPINEAKYWAYTSTWNILDYPAAVFPVTKCIPEIDKKVDYSPRNPDDKYNYDRYDPAFFKDAPVCLQLVGMPWNEELVLETVAKIDALLNQ